MAPAFYERPAYDHRSGEAPWVFVAFASPDDVDGWHVRRFLDNGRDDSPVWWISGQGPHGWRIVRI